MAVATARHLPFRDGSFDALWSMSTLMHVPNSVVEDVLREIRRVLAPGALAAIGVWGGGDVEEPLADDRYEPARLFSRRSDERWRSLLELLGPVEEFAGWPRDSAFWYQWALVRAG